MRSAAWIVPSLSALLFACAADSSPPDPQENVPTVEAASLDEQAKRTCPIIDCAAPPAGCHYEGAVFFPCKRQTGGTLVCDGSTL